MEIKKVGVVGCGLMGSGIAEVCARSGYSVIVREVNEELLQKGLARIQKSLTTAAAKGKITQEEATQAWARIHGTMSLADFSGCDLVVEAAVENMSLKKEIFAELDGMLAPHAILASNTSSLCVTEMASATGRGDKVLGIHFFNPVPVMPLIEFVRTILTSDDTMAAARQFGASLGKTMVTAKDTPGFIVNRLLIPYVLDAVRVYEEGLATREDIDTAIKLGLNHPMGPFEMADLVGLDVRLAILEHLHATLGETFRPANLLRQYVQAGRLGRKTGRGVYEYDDEGHKLEP